MTSEIKAVCWDFDKVAHNDYTTTLLAKNISLDPEPKLRMLIQEKELISRKDMKDWKEFTDREIESIGDLADMLTDFLYDWGRKSNGEILTPLQAQNLANSGVNIDPALSKHDTIIAKQAILKGLSVRKIKEISENIEYTSGFLDAVKKFKEEEIYQVIYSDGAGIVVDHQVEKLGIQGGGGVPPYLKTPEGENILYPDYENTSDKAKLTGKVKLNFEKAKEFFFEILREGVTLDQVAIIDDSGTNLETLHKPIQNHGGLALAFNPKDKYRPGFEKAGIPILDQESRDLRPFKEMVLDREKVENLCE